MRKYPLKSWQPFNEIWQGLPSVFDDFFKSPIAFNRETLYPAIDIYEKGDNVIVKGQDGVDIFNSDLALPYAGTDTSAVDDRGVGA